MNNLNEVPNVEVPSLASCAMLVELKISQWTARKKDRKASDEVCRTNNAQRSAASVNKTLCDCEELTAIKKFAARVRETHYNSTVPWSDSGLRLLSTKHYFKYNEEMTGLQNEFEALAERFYAKYEWVRVGEQARMGDLWVESDYPTVEEMRRKFALRINYIGVPEAGDLRVDLPSEQFDAVKQHYQKFYADQVENIALDIYKRVHTVATALSDRLADPEEGDHATKSGRKRFKSSLVDNALELLEVMEKCNITGDRKLDAMRRKLEDGLRGVSFESLGHSHAQRVATKKCADEILASLPTLDL